MTLRAAWAGIVLAQMALALPAAAQNPPGTLTPFSTSRAPFFGAPGPVGPGAGKPGSGGTGSGGGHHEGHHHPGIPFVVFPFWAEGFDNGGTGSVQSNPVNTAPFAPPTPPTANEREPSQPYKPPSVEIAPGGIEIIRGPS